MARRDNHRRNTGPKKSGRYTQQRGRQSSDPQNPGANDDHNVNDHPADEWQHSNEKRFNILVDSVPYMIVFVTRRSSGFSKQGSSSKILKKGTFINTKNVFYASG